MREWFLSNRIKFLRGKYNSKQYQGGDYVEFRWYFPQPADDDSALSRSAKAVPPSGEFNFKSL
jgi:hypothetical protein